MKMNSFFKSFVCLLVTIVIITMAAAIPIQGRPRRNTVQRSPVDHDKSIDAIRTFLQSKDCLSILPVSSKMIVFDTRLQVIKALNALVQNGWFYLNFLLDLLIRSYRCRICPPLVVRRKQIRGNAHYI